MAQTFETEGTNFDIAEVYRNGQFVQMKHKRRVGPAYLLEYCPRELVQVQQFVRKRNGVSFRLKCDTCDFEAKRGC